MAVQQPTEQRYRCPKCDGTLTRVHRTWQCDDCGHAPNHGAD